jgi:hypothetical protein
LGPGSYELLSDFDKITRKNKGNRTTRGTFGSSRTSRKPLLEVPGPGMYTIDNGPLKRGHSYGFGTSGRSNLG